MNSGSPRNRRLVRVASFAALLAAYAAALELQPQAAEWRPADGGRGHPLTVTPTGRTGFTRQTPDRTGLSFTNHLTEARAVRNRLLYNGSGVALGDVNGDGRCDLYFCRLEGDNALHLNRGNWHFADATARPLQQTTPSPDPDGALLALARPDAPPQLILARDGYAGSPAAPGEILLPTALGIAPLRLPAPNRSCPGALALGDADGDGDLDLFVGGCVIPGRYPSRLPPASSGKRRPVGNLIRTPTPPCPAWAWYAPPCGATSLTTPGPS